jgi:hypothetical protein
VRGPDKPFGLKYRNTAAIQSNDTISLEGLEKTHSRFHGDACHLGQFFTLEMKRYADAFRGLDSITVCQFHEDPCQPFTGGGKGELICFIERGVNFMAQEFNNPYG